MLPLNDLYTLQALAVLYSLQQNPTALKMLKQAWKTTAASTSTVSERTAAMTVIHSHMPFIPGTLSPDEIHKLALEVLSHSRKEKTTSSSPTLLMTTPNSKKSSTTSPSTHNSHSMNEIKNFLNTFIAKLLKKYPSKHLKVDFVLEEMNKIEATDPLVKKAQELILLREIIENIIQAAEISG